MNFVTRKISIPAVSPSPDGVVRVPVYLDAAGDEVGFEFAFNFDPAKYAFKYFVLSEAPLGTGAGTSATSGFVSVGITGYQPYAAGRRTLGELALDVIADTPESPVITFAASPAAIKDAAGNPLDATFYSASAPVEGIAVVGDPVPIGAVINQDGSVTVGHVDPLTGQVHVATANDGKIFGIEPLYLGIGAVVLLFLFSRN